MVSSTTKPKVSVATAATPIPIRPSAKPQKLKASNAGNILVNTLTKPRLHERKAMIKIAEINNMVKKVPKTMAGMFCCAILENIKSKPAPVLCMATGALFLSHCSAL